MSKHLEIYIHIPFCVKKCDYCDFLSDRADRKTKEEYVDALIKEIELSKNVLNGYEVDSIFFGGGTPSILESHLFECIMNAVKKYANINENAEITIECNPGTLTREKLEVYKKTGVNRLSIGLQSANDDELKSIGRIHTWQEFLDNYRISRECGFDNINIDLMSALPGQTISSYNETLEKVVALNPKHISAYSLIVEEGTIMYDRVNEAALQGKDILPDEDTEREMYYMTKNILEENGYHRYEISNYSKEGMECRHNVGYWQRKNYIGFGIGAASLLENERYYNISDLNKYIAFINEIYNCEDNMDEMTAFQYGSEEMMDYLFEDEDDYEFENNNQQSREDESVFEEKIYRKKSDNDTDFDTDYNRLGSIHKNIERLSKNDQMEEFMFLGLRMMEGVNKTKFETLFNKKIENVYGNVLEKLTQEKLLKTENDNIKLTERGIDVSNVVLSEFLL